MTLLPPQPHSSAQKRACSRGYPRHLCQVGLLCPSQCLHSRTTTPRMSLAPIQMPKEPALPEQTSALFDACDTLEEQQIPKSVLSSLVALSAHSKKKLEPRILVVVFRMSQKPVVCDLAVSANVSPKMPPLAFWEARPRADLVLRAIHHLRSRMHGNFQAKGKPKMH